MNEWIPNSFIYLLGLALNYFSLAPEKLKINSIKTLLFRACNISSSYVHLSTELDFLKPLFVRNGYSMQLVENYIRNFLNKLYTHTVPVSTAAKDIKYFSLPYYSSETEK